MRRLLDHPILKYLLGKILDGWDTMKSSFLDSIDLNKVQNTRV